MYDRLRFGRRTEYGGGTWPEPRPRLLGDPATLNRSVRTTLEAEAAEEVLGRARAVHHVELALGEQDAVAPESPAKSSVIGSLAVLPLVDLGGNPKQEYLADGLTEALIADLTRIPTIRVISRTSVMHFKGSSEPLPKIAQRLRVEGLLEGSIQRFGNRVRITARLVHGKTDTQLWNRTYERRMGDLLALQDEIAHAVAQEIRPNLASSEPRGVRS